MVRRFRKGDAAAMQAFAEGLPPHDLLFLDRDLRHPRVIAAWADAIGKGRIDSLVAEDSDSGAIVGTAALVRDPFGWSAHVGQVRLLVAQDRRGAGLGRDLLEGVLAIAASRGLERLSAAMTPDQAGSLALFERMGFRPEARLTRHVRGPDGVARDLSILAREFGEAHADEPSHAVAH